MVALPSQLMLGQAVSLGPFGVAENVRSCPPTYCGVIVVLPMCLASLRTRPKLARGRSVEQRRMSGSVLQAAVA